VVALGLILAACDDAYVYEVRNPCDIPLGISGVNTLREAHAAIRNPDEDIRFDPQESKTVAGGKPRYVAIVSGLPKGKIVRTHPTNGGDVDVVATIDGDACRSVDSS
jgi:hypothetical protein